MQIKIIDLITLNFLLNKGSSEPTSICSANEVNLIVPNCPPEETCDSILSGIAYSCPVPENDTITEQCRCTEGFIRKAAGFECVKSCCEDPNAEVVTCPSPCPGGTCEQPEFSLCEAPCKFRGCQCKKGFVKNGNGTCIPLNQCPKPKCMKNNEALVKVGYCNFEETCESYLSGFIRDCAAPTEEQQNTFTEECRCVSGFVRGADGECVKPNNCCNDENAEVVSCPNPCPGGTCYQPKFIPCEAACKIRGCQCKKGFVKDVIGECIRRYHCPNKCQLPNEEYKKCGSACPATCNNRKPKCINDCTPGCFCKLGYILHKDECIKVSDCPKF